MSAEKEQLELIQGVFDSIPGFVSLFSKDLKYIKVNKTLADACNLVKDDFVGKDLGFIDSGEISEPKMKDVLTSFMNSNDSQRQLEFVITSKDGKVSNTLTSLKKIHDDQEIVVVSIDTTERKIEQDIILKQKDLLIKNSRFTSIGKASGEVAHEIASPLVVITSVASMFKRFKLADESKQAKFDEYVDKLTRQADRIKAIADRLRRVSRSGDHDSFEFTPLKAIFDDAFEVVHEKLSNHHVKLEHNIEESDIELECLRIPLSQVFINLFNNACDAIYKNPDRWIKINATTDKNEVVISVTDSGQGITKEVAEKIFDNGYTTKGIGKGTGLGMSITKDIIEKHKGTITIDHSCSNTRFLIKLPAKQPD